MPHLTLPRLGAAERLEPWSGREQKKRSSLMTVSFVGAP